MVREPVGEDPVEPAQHGRVGRGPVAVKGLHRDHRDHRCEPEGLAVLRADRISDDGGHVRAVTAVVPEGAAVSAVRDQALVEARDVLNGLDPRAGHASVQDGDGDAGAVEALRAEAIRANLYTRILIGHDLIRGG